MAPTRTPSILTSPLSGSTSRLMNFSVVVLPEPEVPTTAMKAPAAMPMVASRTAKVLPAVEGLADLVDLDQRGIRHVSSPAPATSMSLGAPPRCRTLRPHHSVAREL